MTVPLWPTVCIVGQQFTGFRNTGVYYVWIAIRPGLSSILVRSQFYQMTGTFIVKWLYKKKKQFKA